MVKNFFLSNRISNDLILFYEDKSSAQIDCSGGFLLCDAGCVHNLCSLAPNNVNTMAAAAIAGHNLGFLGTQGCLISDPE